MKSRPGGYSEGDGGQGGGGGREYVFEDGDGGREGFELDAMGSGVCEGGAIGEGGGSEGGGGGDGGLD